MITTFKCPKCKRTIEYRYDFCPDCGERLTIRCSQCRESWRYYFGYKHCPSCGAKA